METVFLLIGSNQGDRTSNIGKAIHELERLVGTIVSRSGVYKTAAWGLTDQPHFYNQAVEIATSLGPAEVLKECLSIETMMGRQRAEKWGQRLIDVDILFYGDSVINTDHLKIPHPQIQYRRFTLVPMAEIAPNLVHPLLHETITALLMSCPDRLLVEKVAV